MFLKRIAVVLGNPRKGAVRGSGRDDKVLMTGSNPVRFFKYSGGLAQW